MGKLYDLEERTYRIAKGVRVFVKKLPSTIVNTEIRGQLIRPAGSVGANYNEANEPLGREDFFMKIRICKRESKESCYWQARRLWPGRRGRAGILVDESLQLVKILASIASKAEK